MCVYRHSLEHASIYNSNKSWPSNSWAGEKTGRNYQLQTEMQSQSIEMDKKFHLDTSLVLCVCLPTPAGMMDHIARAL